MGRLRAEARRQPRFGSPSDVRDNCWASRKLQCIDGAEFEHRYVRAPADNRRGVARYNRSAGLYWELDRPALARRNAPARCLASTNATALLSDIVWSLFFRCARASDGESLNRTILPCTMAVARMTSEYAKRDDQRSDSRPLSPALTRRTSSTQNSRAVALARGGATVGRLARSRPCKSSQSWARGTET